MRVLHTATSGLVGATLKCGTLAATSAIAEVKLRPQRTSPSYNSSQGRLAQLEGQILVSLGDVLRQRSESKLARAYYLRVLELRMIHQDTLGTAYLGLGDLVYQQACEQRDQELFYRAFVYFLRAYLQVKDVDWSMRCEALRRAAEACRLWRGSPACNDMVAELRRRVPR